MNKDYDVLVNRYDSERKRVKALAEVPLQILLYAGGMLTGMLFSGGAGIQPLASVCFVLIGTMWACYYVRGRN